MTKRAKETAKDRVLAPEEIRVLWSALEIASSITAALRFLLLTGLRPGEVAGATLGELSTSRTAPAPASKYPRRA